MQVMRSLEGRRVALLEARKHQELAELVTRMGGCPVSAPSVREVPLDVDAAPLLARIVEGRYDIAVLLTAVAFTGLCDAAERHGVLPALRDAFGRLIIASRGPKPQLALRRQSLSATVVSRSPHTSAELLEALAERPLDGRTVLLLHYGERSQTLSAELKKRGAAVDDVCLYEWRLPDDVTPIQSMVRALIEDEIDAVLFTSQVQCRHLFQIASAMSLDVRLKERLQRDVIVAAIGPTCASALRAMGIIPDVMPSMPNSPSLVRAVADYIEVTSQVHQETE